MPLRSFAVEGPLDLRATLGAIGLMAPGQPHATREEGWRITTTPEGPATVHLRRIGDRVEAEAWGPGAPWVLESAPALVGADDDSTAFDPPAGPVRELARRSRGLRLGRTGRVVEVLVPTVLGQRVTTTAAKTSYRKIVRRWGERAPGPVEGWVPPDPEVLGSLTYADLHPYGVERSRASIVIEVARRAHRLEQIIGMPKDDAYRRLVAIRGIGPWTAAQVMGVAWGDRDAVPIGDFHLPNTVAWALVGEPRADDARMLELLEPYAGQRRRVVVLIKQAGIHAPKYGPKTAVRSFETQ